MDEQIAISVSSVTKEFKLPHQKNSSVKGALLSVGKKRTFEKQTALRNVSFEVKKGEFFGIVGRNGSGKSTLLKILAGIYQPSKGHVVVNGSLTPFIELGVGFNPELTGRENVFLNGALLGFNRKAMLAMYDDIVEFAELEKFMDQKLKNYSSGMQVRLAFSIAIRAESDILLVDEVLAVGDEAFQQKCTDVFERYKAEKRTVILVTHDMEAVRNFCSKAILVDNGRIVNSGNPQEVATEYSKLNLEQTEQTMIEKNQKLAKSAIKLKITNASGVARTDFNTHEEIKVIVNWPVNLKNVRNVGLAIHKNSGEYIFGDNTLDIEQELKGNSLEYTVRLDLGPGKYHFVAGLFGDTSKEIIDFIHQGPEFIIKANPEDNIQGLMRLSSKWKYEK